MARIVRLTESELVRLVKKIIRENVTDEMEMVFGPSVGIKNWYYVYENITTGKFFIFTSPSDADGNNQGESDAVIGDSKVFPGNVSGYPTKEAAVTAVVKVKSLESKTKPDGEDDNYPL